jgi:hypothetical protein
VEVEIDEPLLENGLCNGFERGVGLAVELDLVIQCEKNVSDTAWTFSSEGITISKSDKTSGRNAGKVVVEVSAIPLR